MIEFYQDTRSILFYCIGGAGDSVRRFERFCGKMRRTNEQSLGDIIDTYTDWWDTGEDGFTAYTYINGVQNDEYGIERLPADYPCTRFCWPFRFIARTANVRIAVEIVSGNSSGWDVRSTLMLSGISTMSNHALT